MDKLKFRVIVLCFAALLAYSGNAVAIVGGYDLIRPIVTSITSTGSRRSKTNVIITGANFEVGAKVSLLSGGPFLAGSINALGFANAVSVSGNYAYVANGTSGLRVIDISTPSAPIFVGSYDTLGIALGVYVLGNYAYVADGGYGLEIIDISTPNTPKLVGYYATPGIASGVSVSGNYAYVVDGASGLQIIDISTPEEPSLASSYNEQGYAQGIYVSGDYAYIANEGSGLQIIDVSSPLEPFFAGSYDTQGNALGVYVLGNYAYVADGGSGLSVIDISIPSRPTLAWSYATPGSALGVYVSGNYAYVADSASGLYLIDISTPTSPAFAGSYDTPGNALGVYVLGNYAYVAGRGLGLQIVDISTPIGANNITSSYDTPGLAEDLYVLGNYAYVADGSSGLQVIDMSAPRPTLAGAYDTPGYAGALYLSGNYAYVADGFLGLKVIDISTPTNPTLAGSYDTLGNAVDLYVSGNYAYVAGGFSGLKVINISEPSGPSLAGSLDTPGFAGGVYLSGNYAYVADGLSGLHIVDISVVGDISIAGSYNTVGSAEDVYVRGEYAYVADGSSGLMIINISTPSTPFLVGFYNTPGSAHAVSVSGDYAYVADLESGLQVIDISQPSSPILAGAYVTSGSVNGVYLSGNNAYLPAKRLGFHVIGINPPVGNIVRLDSRTITATVPAGFSEGLYHVVVANPEGAAGYLYNKFNVTAQNVTVPSIAITTPTTLPTYDAETETLSIAGTALSAPYVNSGIIAVIWSSDRGGFGVASGTKNWSASGIALYSGDNAITVTAADTRGNIESDVLTVRVSLPVIIVPDDYSTIQGAIDAAFGGQEITVRDGAYTEKIDFKGKSIILRSENGAAKTIINGGATGSVVTFSSGGKAVLKGFTIKNGRSLYGGGITSTLSSPTIIECVISKNTARSYGGGVYAEHSSLFMTGCTVENNTTIHGGGGVYCVDTTFGITSSVISKNISNDGGGGIECSGNSSVKISKCFISDNQATYGSGLFFWNSSVNIDNTVVARNKAMGESNNRGGGIYSISSTIKAASCTISGNTADDGGGIYCLSSDSDLTIVNTILWGNSSNEITKSGSLVKTTYSDVKGLSSGTGNINADPKFVDIVNYYIKPNSPCIDTGTLGPSDDINNNSRPQKNGYDMGANEYVFGVTYAITSNSGIGGKIMPISFDAYKWDDKTFVIEPDNCYRVKDVKVDGVSVGAVASYTFENITASHIINAEFLVNEYTVTSTASEGGTIVPQGTASVICGETIIFTVTPNQDFYLDKLSVDGVLVKAVKEYTFESVSANHTIDAKFKVGEPEVLVTPPSHNFGKLGAGSLSSTQSFAVSNPSAISFKVKHFLISGSNKSDYRVQNDTCSGHTINPLSECSVDVLFLPRSNGERNALLSVVIDKPDAKPVDVPLTGMGTPILEVGPENYPYTSIQAAIDDANNGDTVLVYSGTYVENINFNGKSIAVRSKSGAFNKNIQTIIIGNSHGTASVTFNSRENKDSVLDGFIIQNGSLLNGSGIYCESSSPTIRNCVISKNKTTGDGGGINCLASSPTISNSIISENTAFSGGGVACYSFSSPKIIGCLIVNNKASAGGGVICSKSSHPNIISCTISENNAFNGGAVAVQSTSVPKILNSILWGNRKEENSFELYIDNGSSIDSSYSNIQLDTGVYKGLGNINKNPMFIAPEDYQLKHDSPCIDSGDPSTLLLEFSPDDLAKVSRPQGSGYEMGAYEYIPCSESERHNYYGDLDGDNFGDPSNFKISCSAEVPDGYVTNNSDCDDVNSNINPNTTWYKDADGDGYSDKENTTKAQCQRPVGYKLLSELVSGEDCSDVEPSAHPGGIERCGDGIDQDCSGKDIACEVFDVSETDSEHPYKSIQAAINDAVSGVSKVVINDGTYLENIDFSGKAITVSSKNGAAKTIIDGGGKGHVVTFNSGEGEDSVLDGFTIRNGKAVYGGGVICDSSSPTIKNCVISGNNAEYGAGIYSKASSPQILNCDIKSNAGESGGGVYAVKSSVVITDSNVSGNSANKNGGGVSFWHSSKVTLKGSSSIENNTAGKQPDIYLDGDNSEVVDTLGNIDSETSSLNLDNVSDGFGGSIVLPVYLDAKEAVSSLKFSVKYDKDLFHPTTLIFSANASEWVKSYFIDRNNSLVTVLMAGTADISKLSGPVAKIKFDLSSWMEYKGAKGALNGVDIKFNGFEFHGVKVISHEGQLVPVTTFNASFSMGDLQDSDGDGMPDVWEVSQGLDPDDPYGINGRDGDIDGNGIKNYAEYLVFVAESTASSNVPTFSEWGIALLCMLFFLGFPASMRDYSRSK